MHLYLPLAGIRPGRENETARPGWDARRKL